MPEQDRSIFTALCAVSGIGRQTMFKLQKRVMEKQLSWLEIWHASPPRLITLGFSEEQRAALKEFQADFSPTDYAEYLAQKKIDVVLFSDTVYPQLLQQIPDYPMCLFVKGPTDFWNTLPIAVVGSRQVTGYGRTITERLTRELVLYGATIVSGFMYGVDVVAHQTAVVAGGRSVAVLGFGFNYLYPANQQDFLKEFLAKGNVAVTEFSPGTQPKPGNFPVRNRVVAGLVKAVVVTEAAAKSGTFITVQKAVEYNRAVCAVPGPITSQYSEGTKLLVNEGSKLVSTGWEVIEEATGQKVQPVDEVQLLAPSSPLPNDQQITEIYKVLRDQSLAADDLGKTMDISPATIAAKLSMMELNGLVRRDGERWCVVQ